MPQAHAALASFTSLLERLPALKHIELQGEGEPTLHPDFITMIESAAERGIKVSCITNGSTLRRPGLIDHLLSPGVEKILVSLESANPSQFGEIRGGAFDKVRAGLEALLEARRVQGCGRPVVGLSVTVLKRTIDAFPGIVRFYLDLNLDGGIAVQFLQRMEAYVVNYDEAMRAELLDSADIERFMRTERESRIWLPPSSGEGFYDALYRDWVPDSLSCPWLEHGVFVDYLGNVTPCCKIKDHRRFGFGAVDALGSPEGEARRNSMRHALASGTIPESCRGCRVAALVQRCGRDKRKYSTRFIA